MLSLAISWMLFGWKRRVVARARCVADVVVAWWKTIKCVCLIAIREDGVERICTALHLSLVDSYIRFFFACACSFWLSIIFDALSFTVDVPKQTLWRGCESAIAKKEHQKYKRTHIQIYLGWFLWALAMLFHYYQRLCVCMWVLVVLVL